MSKNTLLNNMLNSIVPISRFNKGEANKIFNEVNKNGCKVVVKYNKPICVLITPKDYLDMVETIEDYKLYVEANRRIENATDNDFVSSDKVFLDFGISKEELNNTEYEKIE